MKFPDCYRRSVYQKTVKHKYYLYDGLICSSVPYSRYMFRGFGVTLFLCLQADSIGSSGCLSDKGIENLWNV
jgi:hypothetical protein